MICEARNVRSSVGFKISARVRQFNFFGQIIVYFVFGSTAELRTLYIQELPHMNTFCECILKKMGLTHAHFQYNSRKLVNVVKVRFAVMYSSRKLNNKKVIATACNFWRQIACSFQVYGCTNHFCAKSTRKTLFWISRFFHLTNIDVTSCFFPTIFPTALRRWGPKNSNL